MRTSIIYIRQYTATIDKKTSIMTLLYPLCLWLQSESKVFQEPKHTGSLEVSVHSLFCFNSYYFIFLINSHTYPLIFSVCVFHHQNQWINLCLHLWSFFLWLLREKKKLFLCQFHLPCCSSCVYFRHVSLHLLDFIVLCDKSKFRKEISGSATHYFLEWITYLVFFLIFFLSSLHLCDICEPLL